MTAEKNVPLTSVSNLYLITQIKTGQCGSVTAGLLSAQTFSDQVTFIFHKSTYQGKLKLLFVVDSLKCCSKAFTLKVGVSVYLVIYGNYCVKPHV